MSADTPLLEALRPLTLVVGKGGVGKTTCAAGLAALSAAGGARTLLIATDPAGTLADAVGMPLTDDAAPHPGLPALHVRQLSARGQRDAFLARWRDTIVQIVDRGTYLDTDDITGLVDAAMPGADEIFAALALARLVDDTQYERVVVDTAPTGHTLRLLALPDTFAALLRLLDAMQDKHRFMVRALTHRYRADAADAFLREMQQAVESLRAALADPARAAAVLVARAEPVVVAETERYASALAALGLRVTAVVVNALAGDAGAESVQRLTMLAPDAGHLALPRLDAPPAGLAAARDLVAVAAPLSAFAPSRSDTPEAEPRRREGATEQPALDALIRPLTIVGGKGGVGKTTVACALALHAASLGRRTLLVSTDPAPSIADALAQPVGDVATPVAGTSHLAARQLDAAAQFARVRDDYQARIDAVFDSILSRGVDVAHDRAIVRDLLALAPPGVDELFALSFLGDVHADNAYDVVIVDPAPTGHLLRLLEMPAIALDWSHRLMRLMLKYKDVVGLGDTAEELLLFARRTRELGAMLRDPARAGLVAVALDEPLVRGETSRLLAAIEALGVARLGVVWNRVRALPTPLPAAHPAPQLAAFAVEPAPVGVEAIRAWTARWTALDPAHG